MMLVYPAIDLKDGQVVQLVGGDPRRQALALPDPIAVAQRWQAEGAPALHVVDLDAALGSGDNRDALLDILGSVHIPVQAGGGVRRLTEIQQFLDSGVSRVILGTQAIKEPRWFEEALRLFPGRLVLAVDARGDEVQVKGWTEGAGLTVARLLERIEGQPLAGLLYTNVDVEGRMDGVDLGRVRAVRAAARVPLIVSGGITTTEDLVALADLGCDAAILGMSLYSGRVRLPDAIESLRFSEPGQGGRAGSGYDRHRRKAPGELEPLGGNGGDAARRVEEDEREREGREEEEP